MAKEVVRQDVIEVSWEIDNNPLSKLINEVSKIRKSVDKLLGDNTFDGFKKGSKSAADGLDEIKTAADGVKSSNPFDEMSDDTKKVVGDLGDVKENAEQIKQPLDDVKKSSQGLKDSTKGLHSPFEKLKNAIKGVKDPLTDSEKKSTGLASKLKSVASVSFHALASGLKTVASHLGTIAKKAAGAALSGLKKVASVSFKALSVGATAAAAGITALVTKSVSSYAETEQLIGGVETLFKDSAGQVQKYANNAYKTAGLSANEYMETVTGFSASLLQSLDQDTAKTAKYADMAISDMADNANKMGTDMGSIQNAYQGFAKQNYTMLDNLKLGYGGTKSEMERLLKDAEKIAGKKFDISSYADIIEAIHTIQDSMDITGTTAKEADKTISGSLNSMKSAWGNLLPALIAGGDSLDQCIGNLVDSIKTFAKNALPAVKKALSGIGSLVSGLAPILARELPSLVQSVLPDLISSVSTLVQGVVSALPSILNTLAAQIPSLLTSLLPSLVQGVMQILTTLAQVIAQNANIIVQGVMMMIQAFLSCLPQFLQAGIQMILALAQGIAQQIPTLIMLVVNCILQLVQTFLNNLPQIIQTGVQIIVALVKGLFQALPQLIAAVPQIFGGFIKGIFSVNWLEVGWEIIKAIAQGIWESICSLGSTIWGWITSIFGGGDTSEAESAGENLGNSCVSGVESSTSVLGDLGTQTGSDFTNGLQTSINGASVDTSGLSNGLMTVGTVTQEMVGDMEKAAQTISTTIQGMSSELNALPQKITETLAPIDALTSKISEIPNIFVAAFAKLTQIFVQLAPLPTMLSNAFSPLPTSILLVLPAIVTLTAAITPLTMLFVALTAAAVVFLATITGLTAVFTMLMAVTLIFAQTLSLLPISCMDSGIGLTVKANELRMISELSSIGLQTCEGVRSEIDINIEADTQDRLMKIYEFGSHAQIAQYAQNDNFTQSSAKGITIGSADCDVYVYLIRAYTSPLQNQEVLTNYIFDGADGSIITDRYNKSLIYDETSGRKVATPELAAAVNPDLHVLVWHADDVSTTKETKINGTLSHIRTSGGAKDKWTVSAVQKVQGTSSVDYIESGANFDFDFKSQLSCDDGTTQSGYAMSANSKPVSYFNFKANVASSEHINNILLAEWFNRFQPWKRPARLNDPTVRDTVEGQMAVLFYHNTSDHVVRAGALEVQPDETVFYSLGCLNNSKKNYAVFGQNDDDDIACIELKNNTSDLARFKTYDLTGENFDGEGTYEFRYLAPTANRAEIIASWQSVLRFVCECNPDTATNAPLDPTVTINGTEYIRDNAAYRKARYKAEFNNYFVGQTVLYHQLFTLFFCMPDNRGKNLFFGYSKILQKWHLVFGYDFDTAMGNDNVGDLTLRYGYLDTDTIGTKNVYNAADSTLWRLNWECFPDELRSLYIQLENEGCWDAEAFAALCTSYQNKICTALRLEDGIKKYEYPFTLRGIVTFFKMCNGFKILQRLQFLKFQPQFISSFMRSGFCKVNKGTLRGYTPTEFAGVQPKNRLTITPYVDTWVYIEAAQQDVTISNGTKVRAYAGVPVVIDFDQIGSMNDTEISIYNADFIQDIGEIACIYVGECNLSAFERLKYARIGSTNNDYVNTNIKTISLANCKSLEYLNLEGCVFDRDTALDLGSNLMLKELYTRRSNVTGVSLAKGGKAQTVLLNDVASFTAKKLRNLQTLSFASYNNLRTVIIEDCQTIDTLALCQTAGKINRLRLTDIAWTLTTAKLLADLANLSGIDDDGYNTQTAVLTGTCSVNQISEYRYNIISAAFPRLVLDTDTENFVASYTVKFLDYDNTVLDTQIVEYGEAAENPVTRVLNPIEIPTKAATVEKVYTFGGWNGSYNSITENTNITAIYTESTRQYTVNFYNGSELLKTETVDAHGSAYCDELLSKEGYLWTGYSASTTDVTQDIDAYATFEQPALPEYAKDLSQFDYLYSEDPADAERSAYTMGQIYEICRQKKGKDYFRVGAELKLLPSAQSTLADSMFVFRVFGYNHYKIANTDEFANVVFGMKGLLNAGRRMNPTNTNSGGYPATERVTWENTTFLRCFSLPWQQLFKSVVVLSSKGETSDVIVSTVCKLFSFSTAELGFSASTVPYKNEVDPDAETITFPIFTDNASRIAKHYNGEGSADNYFLRSPTPSLSDFFDGCVNFGNYNPNVASFAHCVRCGFTL